MKKTILTVGAVGLAVAGSAQTAKADETDLHTNEANEQQVQVQTQTTEQKEETAKSELDDAKNNEQQAQQKADNAQKENDKANQDVANANQNVENKKNDVSQKQDNLNQAEQDKNEATKENTDKASQDVANANQNVENKKNDVANAQQKADEAQNKVDKAQQNVDTAKDASQKLEEAKQNKANAEKTLTDKQKAKDNAQKAYADAKTKADKASEESQKAQQDVAKKQEIFRQKEEAYHKAKDAYENNGLDKAKAELQKAEAELKSAQADYLYAESILAHKNDEKTDLENQLAKQNEIVANAQKEYALAKQAYDRTLTDYTATQKTLNDAKANEKKAQDAIANLEKNKLIVSDASKQKAQAYVKAYNDYVKGGKTDALLKAFTHAEHEMLVQLQNDYTLNIKDNEVYFGDEADKNVAVDLNNLSQAVQEDLANFVATLLNDVRNQLGLTPYVGKVVVTKGMLDMSNAIAKNYVADNWDAFHNAHDDSGVQKGAQQFGMKDADENLGSYTKKITNLYDLKEIVKNSLLSQILNDFHYNTVGHTMSMLGLNYIDDKPSETFFGVSTSYVQGSSNVHFHLIPNTTDEDFGYMKYADWGMNGDFGKKNQETFDQAGGKQEINNPYTTLQNNLNNAKAETSKAQANFNVAEKSKAQAEKAFLEKQSEMNGETNRQKQIRNNLNEATISANKAQFDFENAKNRLETAQNNRTQAQKPIRQAFRQRNKPWTRQKPKWKRRGLLKTMLKKR